MKDMIKLLTCFCFLVIAFHAFSFYTWAQDNSGLVYFNDFETSAGDEWSNNKIEQTPNGQGFLGRFGNNTLTLTINNLATHERVRVSFDLYIIRSWDGDERWRFSIDGSEFLHTSFSHWGNQAYPKDVIKGDYQNPPRTGAAEINTLGYGTDGWGDDVYQMSYSVQHSAHTATFSFSGSNMENLDNESWGIDNIRILAYSGIVADTKLKTRLHTVLNKEAGSNITSADLLNLTSLDARELSIADLTGLEASKNLTTLHLDKNQITDLSSLAELTEIVEITLDDNQITSVEALTTWRGQIKITLNNNLIRDLSPLVDNPWLSGSTEIQLQGNPLSSAALLSQIPALKDRGFTVTHDGVPADAVKFVDSQLEKHLRLQLKKSDDVLLTTSELKQLTRLEARNLRLTDLTGIEHCTNLTYLDFGDGNDIIDLSPLSNLSQLQELYLWHNQVRDVSSLANLTQLTRLDLGHNKITDVSSLSSLVNLTYLRIQENQISDISVITKLTKLTELRTGYNPLSNLPDLSLLTELTYLEIQNCQISSLTPFTGLAKLEQLHLWDNQISDLSSLNDFSQLRELYAGHNQISSIPADLALNTLTRIDLGYNPQLKDYSPLASLSQLTYLNARNNQLSELSTFSSLTQLTQLDLQENQIVDTSALENLTSLNELYLRYNRIVDVSPLANIPQIGRIGLAHNQIIDVSPLANLTKLHRLGLRDNRINDATPLINLVNLDRMGLQENPLSNVSLTHVIPELQNQGVDVNYSSNWSGTALQLKSAFLEQLIRTQASVPLPQTYNNSMSHVLTSDNTTIIATLNLADSSVTDLSGLDGLSNLTSVDISGLKLSSEAVNSQIPALEAKGVQFTKQFDWRASLTVQASDSSALNPQTVFFGVAETATDGLNDGLDVPAPPISPTTENTGVSLDCRFVSPNTTDPDLLTDFHNSSNDPYSYVLKIRADDGDVALNWDISAIPSRFNAVKLKQIETDNPPPVIDLRTSTSSVLALEAGVYHTFELFISGSVTVSLSQGWNMFSIPGEPLVTDPADLFGSDSGVILPLYRWNPEQFTYQAANELKAGDGYWLLTLEENMQVEIPYQAIDSYQKDLAPGWNMIGSTTLPADFTDPQEDPDKAILQYSLFGWNAAAFTYQLANQIEPGKGYWVLALSACQLTITGGTTATAPAALKSPEITIPIRINSETQSYQLTLGLDASASTGLDVYDQLSPPALPSAGNSVAEFELVDVAYRLQQDTRPMRTGTSWQLRLNLPTPSKLEIDTASLPNDFELVVVDSQAGHNLDVGIRRQLTAGQHQVKLELRSKIDLPKVTRVWQNYPNPFNPETWIPFQLHQPSTVGLQIYDVKGQLIRSLDLGQVAAGTYTDTATAIYWDGKTEMGETVASGTYFYTLTTDNYTQTRKMIILK